MDTSYIIPFYNSSTCLNCYAPIEVMIFRGHGWCSEDCRKALVQKEAAVLERLDA